MASPRGATGRGGNCSELGSAQAMPSVESLLLFGFSQLSQAQDHQTFQLSKRSQKNPKV